MTLFVCVEIIIRVGNIVLMLKRFSWVLYFSLILEHANKLQMQLDSIYRAYADAGGNITFLNNC